MGIYTEKPLPIHLPLPSFSMEIPQQNGLPYTDKTKVVWSKGYLLDMVWMTNKNLQKPKIQSCQLITVHLISVVTEKAEVGDASELWVYSCLGTYNQAMSTSMSIGKSWSNLYNTFSPAVHVLLLGFEFPFLVPCTARYFSFEHVQRWPFQCRPWESLNSNQSSEFTN